MRFPTLLSCGAVFFLAVICSQAVTITDSNANGMSDYWEKHWNGGALFSTGFSTTADPDGDGWSNLTESVAGTNPKDANPPAGLVRLKILRSPAAEGSPETAGGAFVVTWPTIAGKQYKLFVSPDLAAGGWVLFDQPMMGTGAEIQIAIEPLNSDGSVPDRLFWRVAVDDVDSNGDGVSEYEAAAAAGGGGPGSIGGPGTIGGGPGSGGNGTDPNGGGGPGAGGGDGGSTPTTAENISSFEASQFVLIPLDVPAATGLSDYEVDTITDDGRVLFNLYYIESGDPNDYNISSSFLWQEGIPDPDRLDSSFYQPFRMFGRMNRAGYYSYQENFPNPADGRKVFMGHADSPVLSELTIPKFQAELDNQVQAYFQAVYSANWASYSLERLTSAVVSTVDFHMLEDGSSFGEVWQSSDFRVTGTRPTGSPSTAGVDGWATNCLKWIQTGTNGSDPQFFEGAGTLIQRSFLSQEFVNLAGAGGMGEDGFCVIRKIDHSGPQVTGQVTNSLRNRSGAIIKQFDEEESDQVYLPATSRNGHVAQSGSSGVSRYHAISGGMEVLPPSIQGHVAGVNDQGDVLVSSAAAPQTASPDKLVRSFLDDASGETTWAQCVFSDDKLPDGWSDLNVQALANSLPLARQRVLESEGAYPPAPEKAPIPLVAGTATKAGKEYPVLMVPVEMVPDYNRDGKITADDKGKVTPNNPFRWWVNDDDDFDSATGGDIPDSPNPDHANETVDGMRDLIDFFPLHLDLKAALAVLPKNQYQYYLKHSENGFRIREFPAGKPNPPEDEFTFAPDAHFTTIGRGTAMAAAGTTLVSATGTLLSTSYLNQAEEGNGLVFFEAAKETTAPIQLEIRKGDEVIATLSFPVRISKVEDMFRQMDLTQVPRNYDGSSSGAVASPRGTRTGDPGDPYPDSLTNGKYFVFLHGFNVSAQNARGWHAEVFKRLYQKGSRARFVGVTWAGDTGIPNGIPDVATLDYHKAVYFALQTGNVLKDALSFTGTADVTLAAHSLGGMVASQAIENGGLIPNRYYMINGAVAREAYDAGLATEEEREVMTEQSWKPFGDMGQQRLYAANWHQHFPGEDFRSKLTWKNRFSKVTLSRRAHNFYSPGDEVVENPQNSNASFASQLLLLWQGQAGRGAWGAQEFVKGGTSFASIAQSRTQGGWGFNYFPENGHVDYWGYWKLEMYTGYRKYLPLETSPDVQGGITNEWLKTKPFFRPFLEPDLLSISKGSAMAAQNKVQYDVLASGIPAMSYAIATNPVPLFAGNYNMEELKTEATAWPIEKHSDQSANRWLHSDFRDTSMNYLHKMYGKMIEIGELNKK